MCKEGYCHYACTHRRKAREPCELATPGNQFHIFAGCKNYLFERKDFNIKCGNKGGYYCARDPDAARLDAAHTFLETVDQESQELDFRHQRNLVTNTRFQDWARRNRLTQQELDALPRYLEHCEQTQHTINDRFALHLKQFRAARVIDYAKAHPDDRHEVGRNDDGTNIWSLFPPGYGRESDLELYEQAVARFPANRGQQQYVQPYGSRGNMQHPTAQMLKQVAATPAGGYGGLRPQPAQQQHMQPYVPLDNMQHPVVRMPGQATTGEVGAHGGLPPQPAQNQRNMQSYSSHGSMQHPMAQTPRQATAAQSAGHGALPPQSDQLQQPNTQTAPSHPLPQPARQVPLDAALAAHHAEREQRARAPREYYGQQLRNNRAANMQTTPAPQQLGSIHTPQDSGGTVSAPNNSTTVPNDSPAVPNDSTTAPDDSPAAAASPKKGKSKPSPHTQSPTPLRRSTRARAKEVKYKESVSDAGDASSREPSPVRSARSAANSDISDYREESPAKSESSSHSNVPGHSSEEVAQEIEELNGKDKKKPAKGRASLTNRIADFQKRTGDKEASPAVASPLGGERFAGGIWKKRRHNPAEYAQGGGGRGLSTLVPLGVGGLQPHAQWQQQQLFDRPGDSRMAPHGGFNPVLRQPNDPDQQRRMQTYAAQLLQQLAHNPANDARYRSMGRQPSSVLPAQAGGHQVTAPPRGPPGPGAHAGMFGDASRVFSPMAGQGPNYQGDGNIQQLPRAPIAQGMQPNVNAYGRMDGQQTSVQSAFAKSSIDPSLSETQQIVTIPSFRGSVTLPASSDLLHCRPGRPSNNSAAEYLNRLTPTQRATVVPQAFHFQSTRTPNNPPSRFDYAEALRIYNNPPTMTLRSSNPATAAERTTDPQKKPTPSSDEASPAKRVRLSLPGQEGAPVWPAEWRRDQQRESIRARQADIDAEDPFMMGELQMPGEGERLNFDSPKDLQTLNAGFLPAGTEYHDFAAPAQAEAHPAASSPGNDESLDDPVDVFIQAVQAAEDGAEAERAADVLMGIVSGSVEEEGVEDSVMGDAGDVEGEGEGESESGGVVEEDVDWGDLNDEVFEE